MKIGVVGCGHIVKHRHIPIFKKIGGVEVFGVCDKVEIIARDVAKEFGVKNYFTDLSDMLKMGVDVVDICTPPQTHKSFAIQAMEAGCHVLVEKPLAMTVEEIDEMYSVSKKEGVKLCVLHQNLFNPAFQKAASLVKEGLVGDVLGVDVGTFIRKDNYMSLNSEHWCHKLPGGIFFEILPHPVYLLQYFLKNAVPSSVLAKHLGDFSWMKVDELKVLVEGDNGIGLVVASCNSPFHGDSVYIVGSKMCLQVDLWGRSVIKYKPRTEQPYSVGKGNISLASQFFSLIGTTTSNSFTAVFSGEKVSSHYGFIKTYVNALEKGSQMPVSEEDARDNVRIVETICGKIEESVG